MGKIKKGKGICFQCCLNCSTANMLNKICTFWRGDFFLPRTLCRNPKYRLKVSSLPAEVFFFLWNAVGLLIPPKLSDPENWDAIKGRKLQFPFVCWCKKVVYFFIFHIPFFSFLFISLSIVLLFQRKKMDFCAKVKNAVI